MRLFLPVLIPTAALTILAGAAQAYPACAQEKYDAIVAVLMDPAIWTGPDGPIFTEQSVPDHGYNRIRDDYELALSCLAMCEHPGAQAAYDANYATGESRAIALGRHVLGWATLSGAYGMITSTAGIMAWWGVPGLNPWTVAVAGGGTIKPLEPGSDYDGDGFTNKQEYDYVFALGGTPQDYADAAAGGAGSPGGEGEGEGEETEGEGESGLPCEEKELEDLLADFTLEEILAPGEAAPDHNWNEIPDDYELALLAVALCRSPGVQARYAANLAVAESWNAGNEPPWGHGLYEEVAAAYATMGSEGMNAVNWLLGIFAEGFAAWDTAKSATEPLSASGDYDGDGYTNFEEYQDMAARGASPAQYAYAASGGFAGPGMPVAGVISLGLMSGVCGLGGIVFLRGKK